MADKQAIKRSPHGFDEEIVISLIIL